MKMDFEIATDYSAQVNSYRARALTLQSQQILGDK